MFPATLHVESFRPNDELILEQSFFEWRILPRLLVTLFFVPFLIGPLLPLFISLGESGSSGQAPSEGTEVVLLAGLIVFGLFWYGGVALFMYLAGLVFGCWNRFALNGGRELSLTYEGTFIWGQSSNTIPMDRIREMTLIVSGRGNQELPLTLELTYETEQGNTETVSPRFRVRHVDLIEEAMALGAAIGNILDFRSMEVQQRDHLESRFLFTRDAPTSDGPDDEGLRPIPTIDADLQFEEDVRARSAGSSSSAVSFGRPEIDLPPFDPDQYQASAEKTFEAGFEWNPGERVRIDVSPMPAWAVLLISTITGITTGLLLPMFLGGAVKLIMEYLNAPLPLWVIGIGVGGIGFGSMWIYLRRKYCRRQTDLDWESETYSLRIGKRIRNGTFDQIRAFVVKGHQHKGDENSSTDYECEVQIDLDDGRETIFRTEQNTDQDAVYEQAGSLAEDLADAIGVEWKWKGFE